MKLKVLSLLFALFFYAVVVDSQEVIKAPILRIENGSHIGKLTKISIDAADRYLVTAAEDKTVRVWELSSGKLLSILRPPIGEDKDGMVYTVSISPDGNTIAAGGWSGNNSRFYIYIFDRESGRIIHQISGFREVIKKLTFSPDGKYLGAMLGGRFGMRLFETTNYRLVGEDSNYGASSNWLEFSPTSDRLATSSWDGFIRLYEIDGENLRLLKRQNIMNRPQPSGLKFSPDGSKIAVGFYLTTALSVVSADDLSFLYDADISKLSKTPDGFPVFFDVVTWSADGKSLLAGGTNYSYKKGAYVIGEWTDDGRQYSETGVSDGAIFDIVALQSGGVVFGVAAPAGWGVLDANRRRTHYFTTDTPDFRNSSVGVLVNEDATRVRFPYGLRDQRPAVFSLPERKLELREAKEKSLKAALVKTDELKLIDFTRAKEPSLNGAKLKLDPYERSYSMSILPDRREFLIGSGWYLRLFNERGIAQWRTSVPGVVWCLNNSGDGRFAVAGLGDGTIRWYRISDGQEVLAFFSPKDDAKRWIVWTPSGYYDASPDAEDLIGWHVNNGREAAADFFPNHLFKAYFNRPDVIDRILLTADETEAVNAANTKSGRKEERLTVAAILPPVIEINAPKIKEVTDTTVRLSYNIRNHSGEPVTDLKAIIDGKEVRLEKPSGKTGTSEFTIQIPKKDSELILIAENRYTKSLPANVKFKWKN